MYITMNQQKSFSVSCNSFYQMCIRRTTTLSLLVYLKLHGPYNNTVNILVFFSFRQQKNLIKVICIRHNIKNEDRRQISNDLKLTVVKGCVKFPLLIRKTSLLIVLHRMHESQQQEKKFFTNNKNNTIQNGSITPIFIK